MSNPVPMIRHYSISKDDVSKTMPILEDVLKIMDKEEVNVRAFMPVLSMEMSRIDVSYQFKSLDHLGEVMDGAAADSEMQSLIERANTFSSLQTASVMVAF